MNEYEHFRKIIIDDEFDDINEYIKRVKNMMFSMIYIKFDIKFVLFKLNQYMNNFKTHHDIAIKQAFKYFQFTIKFRLKYEFIKNDNHEIIKIHCDSNFA